MNKLKILTVVGTRPELIRLSRTINCLDIHFNHILVHTGQNYDYELNQIFFEDLQIRKPDYFLNSAGANACQTISQIISSCYEIFNDEKPDAVLLLGDTNSCMAAIPAKKLKIPLFHMEAGNRCFDQRVPEETNRKIVDHISDINLTYSQISRENLLNEGLPPENVICVGSPLKEVIHYYKQNCFNSNILEEFGLQEKKYFLVSFHREENVDSVHSLRKFTDILIEIARRYQYPIIVSTHPRTRLQLSKIGVELPSLIRMSKPLGYFDYIKLQTEAHTVLSDSGSITEEASILNFPALNLRETHERLEGMEEAAVMMVGLNLERVLQGLRVIESERANPDTVHKIVEDYNVDNVSAKILKIILSYIDFVNLRGWRKN